MDSYSWNPSLDVSLDDFLKKHKPSMIVDDGTKPWIWVRRTEHEPFDEADPNEKSGESTTLEQATQLLEEYTEKIAAVQKDDSIPMRSNKKKGLRSKKEVREEIMANAAKELKEISQESKLTCGKWLFFATPDSVDGLFARLAHELVTGPLSKTPAFCTKVATTPATAEPNYRHVICLYLPDLYDKDAVTEVLRIVCQTVGARPNSAKTDLYTLIGLDSKHPSGIKSTIWNPHDLIPETELKTLIDTYWEDAKKKAAELSKLNSTTGTMSGSPKKNTKLKRKNEESDDEHVFDEIDGPKETKSTNKTPAKTVTKPVDPADSVTESESDDPPEVKAAPSVIKRALPMTKRAPATKITNKVKEDDSSSDEYVKQPKKIRRF